jgi:hypothetical protein
MENQNEKALKKLLGIVGTVVVVGVGLVILGMHNELSAEQNKLSSAKQEVKMYKSKLDESTRNLNEINKAKNGGAKEGLDKAVQAVFKAYYTRGANDTENDFQVRRQNAVAFADEKVVNDFIGKKLVSGSVQVTSEFKKADVYLQSSNDTVIHSVVMTTFNSAIADQTGKTATYMFKVDYNQFTKKIVSIKSLGQSPYGEGV